MVNFWWSVGFIFLSSGIMFAGMYDDNSVMKVPVSASMTKDEKLWQMKEALLNADKQCRPQTQLYNKDGTPELITIMRPDGSVSEIIKGDVGHVSIGTIEKGSVILHTHPMDSKVKVERESNSQRYSISSSQLGPSGADILIAKQTQSTVLALDCASGMILGVDANGNAVEVYFDEGKKTAVIQSLANENRSQQLEIDDRKSMTRDYSQTIADKRLENRLKEVENTSSDRSNSNTLHSLADLLETGEEIVEVREDMREDRHERKAREQAERERKAAEEERLLQQQLDAQRRKAQSEQKKSKSSGAEVARRPTPTTQQNRPAGTKPATETGTEPTDTGSQTSTTPPAQTTVRIDFTPLDNCTSILNSSRNLIGSLAASMVEVAMSNGEKAYSKLKSQIASLPEGDQKKQLEQTLEAKYAAFKAAKSYYE